MSLEPIEPETALELYLADRENEISKATKYAHSSRIGHLVRWCDNEDITNLNSLTGRRLQEFRLWRRNEGGLAPASEKTQMDTIRVFVRWLESIDAVETDLSTKVQSPALDKDDNVREVMLEADQAEQALSYLTKFHYCSLPHVALELLWHTMMRIGAARALDVDDYSSQEQYLEINHRPDLGTPLKNKTNGERMVALSSEVCSLLDDWIDNQRPDVTDDFGRSPLLASTKGRVATSTLRSYSYQFTRPCVYQNDCPHGREVSECPATSRSRAGQCPSSVSPHAIRRGSITNLLNNEMPEEAISDRADVSPDVLDMHYDGRTRKEKMEQRRRFLDNL